MPIREKRPAFLRVSTSSGSLTLRRITFRFASFLRCRRVSSLRDAFRVAISSPQGEGFFFGKV
jgi:hypothetical protein